VRELLGANDLRAIPRSRARPNEVRECPICGSHLVRRCERVDGSRVVRCSGGHVLPASALELF
jgi:hypothetical protein